MEGSVPSALEAKPGNLLGSQAPGGGQPCICCSAWRTHLAQVVLCWVALEPRPHFLPRMDATVPHPLPAHGVCERPAPPGTSQRTCSTGPRQGPEGGSMDILDPGPGSTTLRAQCPALGGWHTQMCKWFQTTSGNPGGGSLRRGPSCELLPLQPRSPLWFCLFVCLFVFNLYC